MQQEKDATSAFLELPFDWAVADSKVISDDKCWKDKDRRQDGAVVGWDWRVMGGLPKEVMCRIKRATADGLREVGRGQGMGGFTD